MDVGFRGGLLARLAVTGLLAWLPASAQAGELVRIGGSGMALVLMQQFGERLAATDPAIRTEVLPSIGTPGGIKALLAGEIDIAIAARPLGPEERAKGLREAACMTTALIFATSHPRPSGVTRAGLPALYADPQPKWADGTPLKIILRAQAGSENPYLTRAVPGLESAFQVARRRPGVPVGMTDQDNLDLAHRVEGSFAITSLLQIRSERARLLPVPLDGVAPSPDTIASGAYPFPLRVCLLSSARVSPGAARFLELVGSPAGQALIQASGARPSA